MTAPADRGDKRVLVTGATGFIARHSLVALVARGFEVHAVSRRRGQTPARVELHTADLLDPVQRDAVIAAVRPSHLLHAAWEVSHGAFWTSEDNLRWVEASLGLARAFRAHGGRRMVVVGTSAEYDPAAEVCDEAAVIAQPATIYGAAKHALHVALRPWAERAQIGLAWARMFFLYGPDEQRERLVPYAIRAFLRRDVAQFSTGTQLRDFQHASDAGGALAAVVDSDLRGPVNIGSGKAVAVRDVILEIARQLDASELVRFGARTGATPEPPRIVADGHTLRDRAGWRDRYDLATGIADTIAWWRTQPPS